jgi:transposase InsO family protein
MAEGKGSINLSSVPRLHNNSTLAAWRNGMETQLLIAGARGVVEGSDVEPNRRIEVARYQRAGSVMPSGMEAESHEMSDEQREAWKKWQRREDLAQGMIRGTVSDGILVDLLDCHSAKEMWDFILDTNSLEDPETQAEIWNEFARMHLEEDPTAKQMEQHIERYNSLLLKASYAGLNIRETERIDRFLITLPKSFEVFRMQFRSSNHATRTWRDVRKEYNREQSARETRARLQEETEQQHASAMAVRGQKPRRDVSTIQCYRCDEYGHYIRDCPKPRDTKKTDTNRAGKAMMSSAPGLKQWAMSMAAVGRGTSPKRWMWDEDYGVSCVDDVPEDSVTPATPKHQPAADIYSAVAAGGRDTWILDSGATHHISPNRSNLSNITPLDRPLPFTVADGSSLIAREKGDLAIRLSSGKQVLLEDVHVVSGAAVNLLSARQLARTGWSVSIERNGATIRREDETVTLSDAEGLWTTRFDHAPASTLSAKAIVAGPPTLQEEHERLGHMGRHKLIKLAHQDQLRLTHTAALLDAFRIVLCNTCQKIRLARRSKDGTSPHGTRNGELIHVDVAGPFDDSCTGHDHFIIMLDDYSKVCAVVPMKGRKHALGLLREFVLRLETQLGETVRFIRSDNGPEFVSGAANEWYKSKGIIHQVSPRYTPELNGTIERFIRTVKEMVGSMLDDSQMDHGVWDFAAQYAAVILMKTTNGKDGKSAWEKYTGRQNNIDSIIKFGAPCFVHVPRQARTKARLDEPKAIPGKVVGQADNISGWIVKADSDGAIHRSRDVRLAGAHGTTARVAPIEVDKAPEGVRDVGVEMRLDVQDMGSASGPPSRNARATTPKDPEVDVTGPPDASLDVDGDLVDDEVVRRSRGEEVAARPPVTAVVSDSPLADHFEEQSANSPTVIERIRPSSTWELVPDIVEELPPASFTDDTGRRVMTRRAPGRSFMSMITAADDGDKSEIPVGVDVDVEVEMDLEARQRICGLTIGWLLSTTIDADEPRTVTEALRGPSAAFWLEAIQTELRNLISKQTWSEVKKPAGRKEIGCRWVLKVKRDAEGRVVKYKARLVAQGFSQVPGVDFEETYAPVGRTASLRIMLAIAAHLDLEILQADVEGAYLNGVLDVDICDIRNASHPVPAVPR